MRSAHAPLAMASSVGPRWGVAHACVPTVQSALLINHFPGWQPPPAHPILPPFPSAARAPRSLTNPPLKTVRLILLRSRTLAVSFAITEGGGSLRFTPVHLRVKAGRRLRV